MNVRNKSRPLFAFLILLVAGLFELSPPAVGTAHAIIGRPLTPMSYAGVARRTTRRAAYAGAYAAPYAYRAPYVAPAPYAYPPPYAPPPAAAYW